MKQTLSLLLTLLITAPAWAANKPKKQPKPVNMGNARVEVYKTVGEVKLKAYIFEPEGLKAGDNRPAAVFFFGGGWNGGTPSQFKPHCEFLASRGMVAMAMDYRVKSRQGTTPFECVKDGKSAIRWVRQQAKRLGVDAKRVAGGGGSAGGHVAAATGNCPGLEEAGEDLSVSSKPDALLLFNPVYDNGPTGYGHSRVKDRWQEISPMHNIHKGAPPTIVWLGTKDSLIPVATAETYKKKMEDAGSRCDLHLYEGQTHGFFNQSKGGGVNYNQTIKELDAFLISLGWLK